MPPDVVLLANSSSPHKAKDIGKISDTKPSSLPASLEAERALLWQRAYEEVRKENATLVSNYEAILASVSDVDIQDAKTHPLPNQLEAMQHVVDFQQQRMLNKQWTWSMFGSNTKIRDTVDDISAAVCVSTVVCKKRTHSRESSTFLHKSRSGAQLAALDLTEPHGKSGRCSMLARVR
jgi:hypothetical protein